MELADLFHHISVFGGALVGGYLAAKGSRRRLATLEAQVRGLLRGSNGVAAPTVPNEPDESLSDALERILSRE